MHFEGLFFWRNMTMSQRRLAFRAGFWVLLGVLVLSWFLLYFSTQQAEQRVQQLEQRYRQAAPVVEQVLEEQANKGALAGMAPFAATQQIVRELGLESRLASIRPAQLDGGGEGVQLVLESLNLPEVLDLLEGVRQRGGLAILSFSLTHRLDTPDLADLQLVLGR